MNQLQPSSSSSSIKAALVSYDSPGTPRKVALVAPKIFCPDENSLPTVKAQIDYFAQENPFELIELFQDKKGESSQLLYPIEIISLLARDEFAIRGNQEQGLSPERHEPVYALAAMKALLEKRGIPSEMLITPESWVADTANSGSARLFNLLLENGVKPNFGKTREALKGFWKECIEDSNTHIKKYWKLNAAQNGDSKIQNNMPQWPLEGILACTGNLMANFKSMDFSLRTYDQVHRFIGLLRERVYERRQEKLLAELEAEENAPKKPSKSAKRKARQKVKREQKAAIKPPSPKESAASGTGDELSGQAGCLGELPMGELPVRPASPVEESHSGAASLIMPDDSVIRELRERVLRLLPTQADRDEFRARVQALKNRMEKVEQRFEEIKAKYSNKTQR